MSQYHTERCRLSFVLFDRLKKPLTPFWTCSCILTRASDAGDTKRSISRAPSSF